LEANGPGQEAQAAGSGHSEAPTPIAAEIGGCGVLSVLLEKQNSGQLF
jgi:hypothetical protein